MTITEALAEIKTINARIGKKREAVMRYFIRPSAMRDPMEKEAGGTEGFIQRERQGIADLEQRIVTIRTAIQRKNLETWVTVGETARPVQQWLNWRREVAPGQQGSFRALMVRIDQVRLQGRREGKALTASQDSSADGILVLLNEKELAEQAEKLEQTLGGLDGKLSLMNATTTIEILV